MTDPGVDLVIAESQMDHLLDRIDNGVDGLIHYVMDLEALVRWFALPFRYQDQEGEWHQNEPIWTVYDERGTYLPEADRLKRTWEKVMHDG